MKFLFILPLCFSALANSQNHNLLTLEEITRITPEMVQFLETNIPEDASHSEKLVKLVKLIFNKNFLNLSYDNNRTKTAAETFETRSGNCISFTNMFVVMARHLGLTARFQEVRNLPTWDRNGKVVVLNRHINVLVQLRERLITVDFNPYEDHKQVWTEVVKDERAYAQFYNNYGAEAFAKGNNDLAKANFDFSIQIEPEMSFSRTNLGVVYSNEGAFDLAEKIYLEALALDHSDMTAVNNLAALYRKMGNTQKAEQYQKRVNSFRKKNPYFHYQLGIEAYQNEKYEEAIVHFKRAIRRKEVDHQFYFSIAKAYAFLGRMEKASENLKKAQLYAPEAFDQQRYSQKLNMLAAH